MSSWVSHAARDMVELTDAFWAHERFATHAVLNGQHADMWRIRVFDDGSQVVWRD
jgi:hypothetical protein